MRKKSLVLLILFVFLLSFNLYSAKIMFKIPLRVIKSDQSNINKDDISIKINGKLLKKFEFYKKQRGMIKKGLPLKYYILDFNIFNYYEDIAKGIDYFIDNILIDEPIIVATRSKVYRFFNYTSKTYLKENIKKLVKQDTIKYQAETKSYYKKFKEILNGFSRDKEGCRRFIDHYLREWKVYKTRYIYPDIGKYQMLSNLLADKDGDKYIISFQHRQIIPFYQEVQEVLRRMNDFVSSAVSGEDQAWATMISGGINDINQSFLLSKDFSPTMFSNLLLINNIGFNLILLNNKMIGNEKVGRPEVSPDMEMILRTVSTNTGGLSVVNDNLNKALGLISNNVDNYYCILFPLKKVKDLNIKILPEDKKIKLGFPTSIQKNFIKNILKSDKQRLKIENVNVSNGRIHFEITNFKLKQNKAGKLGVLKINIYLKDLQGKIIYKTGNTLNSVKNKISITLPPLSFKGDYKLLIITKDLLGESSRIFEKNYKF